MQLNNSVKSVRVIRDRVVRVVFSDGYVGEVDLSPLLRQDRGPLVEELRDPGHFKRVAVQNHTLTFANGYDICPDVLRFYCERGLVVSQRETDAAFARFLRASARHPVGAVAEAALEYGTKRRRR